MHITEQLTAVVCTLFRKVLFDLRTNGESLLRENTLTLSFSAGDHCRTAHFNQAFVILNLFL